MVLFNVFLKWTSFLIGILLVIVFVPMVYSYALEREKIEYSSINQYLPINIGV